MLNNFKKKIKNFITWKLSHKYNFNVENYEKNFFKKSLDFFKSNEDINYSVKFGTDIKSDKLHKWVGAQVYKDSLIYIPNDEERLLKENMESVICTDLKESSFKWTGGAVWNNKLYCFPRASNFFLIYDGNKLSKQELKFKYEAEHHYGGVCTNDGVVYQPPRNTDYILKTDLKAGKSYKIVIAPLKLGMRLRYCGTVLHPNGLIYFLPEDNRVIVLDPKTDRWSFIGRKVQGMAFDAKIGVDGNIYGFSAYGKGILKISVDNNKVEMIHTDYEFGAYGTKYGLNGMLYSIPGDGEYIWSYNVLESSLKKIYKIKGNMKAKYAGGLTTKDGMIVGVPAQESKGLFLIPDRNVKIPQDIYNTMFYDTY